MTITFNLCPWLPTVHPPKVNLNTSLWVKYCQFIPGPQKFLFCFICVIYLFFLTLMLIPTSVPTNTNSSVQIIQWSSPLSAWRLPDSLFSFNTFFRLLKNSEFTDTYPAPFGLSPGLSVLLGPFYSLSVRGFIKASVFLQGQHNSLSDSTTWLPHATVASVNLINC